MDGFRDRLNRGNSERGSYDRYDRGARRSSYGAPASAGVNIDEIAQLVDESNGKQLDVINDLFEDAKDDRYESEKQILAALEDVILAVQKNADSAKDTEEFKEVAESENTQASNEEILRTVTSNADLLAQFAEEQLPMLIRGNSSILNQIRESLDEKDDILREILRNSSSQQEVSAPSTSNDEVLSAAATNNALLNALRSDIAGIQSEIRSTADRISANADEENAPLDSDDRLTKAQADEMYKSMEEMVHGECVKVYRNVQKVLEDQNGTIAASVKSGVGGIKGLAIINLVLLLLNLVALLAHVFGII